MKRRSYIQSQIEPARAALKHGGFTRYERAWDFNGRRYGNSTIRKLLDNGEAVRIGDRVMPVAMAEAAE